MASLGTTVSVYPTPVKDEKTKPQRREMSSPSAHRTSNQDFDLQPMVLCTWLSDFGTCKQGPCGWERRRCHKSGPRSADFLDLLTCKDPRPSSQKLRVQAQRGHGHQGESQLLCEPPTAAWTAAFGPSLSRNYFRVWHKPWKDSSVLPNVGCEMTITSRMNTYKDCKFYVWRKLFCL